MKKFLNRRNALVVVVAVVLVAVLVVGVRSAGAERSDIPVAEVKKGEFVEYLQVRGEIKARNSKILTAPSVFGDLQIIKLQKTGSTVKQGDVIVQFDTTTLQRQLDQKRSELRSAEAEIQRQAADGKIAEEQAITDSVTAKYGVERAKLDVQKQEILSEIEGEKTKLSLVNSQEKLNESEVKVNSGRISVAANVEMKKKKKEKSVFDVELAERQIESLTLKAPADGMVTVLPNFRASMFGGNPPEFKEGDRAWSGAAVAEIPDLREIKFEARIDEADRGRLKPSQEGLVRIDAVPDKEFKATIRDISTLAKLDFSGWPPAKNFAIDVQLNDNDPRIKPGMSASTRVAIDRVPDAITIPSEALFHKDGRPVVYVQTRGGFEERAVKPGRRSGSTLQVLSGLQQGEKVALKDPTEGAAKK